MVFIVNIYIYQNIKCFILQLNSIAQFNMDTVPIGKLAVEHLSEEPDTDDEDGNKYQA